MIRYVTKSMTLWVCAAIGVLFIAEAMVGTVGRHSGPVGSLQVSDNWQDDPTNGAIDDDSASTAPDDVYDSMDIADPDDAAQADDVDTAQSGDVDQADQDDSDTNPTSVDSSDASSDDGSTDDTPDSGDNSDSDVSDDQVDSAGQ